MATVCAISGELPQVPVISRKSGNVYEKRLIEAYILENGTEPTTGALLTVEDLIEIQGAQTVRPRPPELTSIPALLGVFQQEWDALALEVFTLQQNLAQTRQELSTALYQHDAAVRVIARLTQERDAAREALKNINVNGIGTSQNGESMQIDTAPLSEAIQEKINSTQAGLMKTRRKRPVPEEWATADTISLFKPSITVKTPCADPSFLSVRQSDNSVLVGSKQGGAFIVSPSENSVAAVLSESEAVTAGLWAGSRVAVATSSGKVKIIEKGQEVADFSNHSAAVTGVSLHPSGEILASASADKTYALYDLDGMALLTQVQTPAGISCTAFHPDGHLLATGGSDGQLRIYDVKSGSIGGEYTAGAPIKALCFSENGTWLASASVGSTIVSVWDLRKTGAEGLIHTLEAEHEIEALDWDYTAQYLLLGGAAEVTVKQYTKSTKLWSEPFKAPVPSTAVGWGDSAQSILAIGGTGTTTVLSST